MGKMKTQTTLNLHAQPEPQLTMTLTTYRRWIVEEGSEGRKPMRFMGTSLAESKGKSAKRIESPSPEYSVLDPVLCSSTPGMDMQNQGRNVECSRSRAHTRGLAQRNKHKLSRRLLCLWILCNHLAVMGFKTDSPVMPMVDGLFIHEWGATTCKAATWKVVVLLETNLDSTASATR